MSGQRGHWAGDLGCIGTRDTNFTTWPDEQMLPDREDCRAIVMVELCFACDLRQCRRGACRSDYNTTSARLSVA